MARLAVLIVASMLFSLSPAVAAEQAGAAAPAVAKGGEGRDGQPSATGFRIGYVDMLKVAEQTDIGKTSRAHFEAKADRYKARIETKQKMLEKQKATLEAKLPTYTPEQRVAKVREYEKKVDELRTMLKDADKELKPLQEEMARELYGRIEQAAREYALAKGLLLVLEKKELLYLGSGVAVEDVTDALVSALNRK